MAVEQLYASLGIENPWGNFQETDRLPFDGHGWFAKSTQEALATILKRIKPAVVVELGSWLGASTRFLAQYCPLVIAVDHWKGSPEHHTSDRGDVKNKLPTLYEQFLSNCWDLRDRIAPLRMTTTEALGLPLPVPGLIYVDADHNYEAVLSDLEGAWKLLGKRGILCGDDWKWKNQNGETSVRKAVEEFAANRSKTIKTQGVFWQLTPKASGATYATADVPLLQQSVPGTSMPMGGTTTDERKTKGGRAMTARAMVESKMSGATPQPRGGKVKVTGNPVMAQSPLPKGARLRGMHDSRQEAPKTHVTLEHRKPQHLPKAQGQDKLPQAKILKMGQRTQVPRPKNVKIQPRDNVIRKAPGQE